ncbi:hypothetical protein [Blastococcus sp. CT_GayMR16]|uniref:hypothetical protein n=1 Tax=Blastococcus sp. CT_GayMR16 TaxID=2559607 RepID=UPI001074089F|nr:hypothetical protein [Blastococcus sp. CT_GayMR16]TFV87546.1 hypothetical protein E4P38_12910 [Blastococcus sp. CT_GayMR16]
MILAAGLLVLLGLGLFVAGILTGVTVLYWGCVAACVVAAVLLIAVRRQIHRQATAGSDEPAEPAASTTSSPEAATSGTAPAGATAAGATAVGAGPAADEAPAGRGTADESAADPAEELPDPEVEEVEVTDLLIIVDLKDEVLVVDEHPRYHLAGCRWIKGRGTIPLPLDEARTDGFTPCAVCEPDRNLADRARARKHPAES